MTKMNKKGFSLVETMVVVAIIGLLCVMGISYIMGSYSAAQEATIARNIAEINQTKAQLTLPVGTAGGEGYTESTVVDDAVKGKINALLGVESESDLAVGSATPDYGATIGDPAKYTGTP